MWLAWETMKSVRICGLTFVWMVILQEISFVCISAPIQEIEKAQQPEENTDVLQQFYRKKPKLEPNKKTNKRSVQAL